MAELRATYRLQLRAEFGFAAAAAVVPQLAQLGISHLYLSPIMESARGSTHGYDVVDHGRISEALGGRTAFDALVATARAHHLGILVDIVPNHMSIADASNRWWWDVLENGHSARSAHVFDVDWDPPEQKLKEVVLVPVLGEHRGKILKRGEIKVSRNREQFVVQYHEHRYPVAPRTVGIILADAAKECDSPRMAFLADTFAELPSPNLLDETHVERRHRDRVVLAELLRELLDAHDQCAAAVDAALARLNGDIDALDAFLDRQNYRLAYWRSAERDLDYRRFFDVSTLVGLRVEDPRTFQATHSFLATLIAAGSIDGVRVDHIDGLADPAGYLASLRKLIGMSPIYVEKILAVDEALPAWPVEGTTGYDFTNDLVALYVDPRGEIPLAQLARELTGEARAFGEIATESRLLVLDDVLGSDVHRLSSLAASLCERYRDTRDFTRHDMHEAVRALLASFPVYRSYVVPARGEVSDADKSHILRALAGAATLAPHLEAGIFGFLGELLMLERTGDDEALFVKRFQQTTPPALAKGIEDTAFYRDPRLIALDEVGGDPARFSMSIADFHRRNLDAAKHWPQRMLATSTHDTKRSEDVRAGMVLVAEEHAAFSHLARQCFQKLSRRSVDHYSLMLLLQTLVGAWPIDRGRLAEYMTKAAREGKRRTSWSRPDQEYEAHLLGLVDLVMADVELCEKVAQFVQQRRAAARTVSLGWTLLKITCPGIPDFYQGNELFRLDLVDPDNRREIDWKRSRNAASAALPSLAADDIGVHKIQLIQLALRHRQNQPERFAPGSTYEPLEVHGPGADHVIAFARNRGTVVVVPRWPTRLEDVAGMTHVTLPPGVFRSVLVSGPATEGTVSLADLFAEQPVAMLSTPSTP